MKRNLEIERKYRELSRRVSELSDERRQALSARITTMTEGPVTKTLREAIEHSKRTPCSIAREAGLDTASMYRFLSGERQLKSESIDLLCQVLSLELRPAKPAARKTKSA